MRRGVDGREPQGDRPDQVAQLEPWQRRGEQDIDVAAAARRDVGDEPDAEALEQLAELGGQALDLIHQGAATFMAMVDSRVVNIAASASRVKIKGQQAPGAGGGVIDRHRRRLQRWLSGKRAGMTRRERAGPVFRDPNVRSTCEATRDRMPSSLREGTREAVRNRVYYTRRVARGQC